LVILHSWSAGYLQHAGIPYAMWAQENGWAVIAPQFRGVNDDADAMGSDLAVQDVVDAIDYATSQDGVDADRVYTVGYSGGGMMSLLLAGRHPDKVTAVAAWGPPYDLVEFYRQSLATGGRYAADIRAGCGGDPAESGPAQEECLRRIPMTYLDTAREKGVPVFIAQGIFDSLLSPSQGASAFNQLADPEDRLSAGEVDEIGRGSLPDHLSGSITTQTYFGEGDPAPVFARQSGAVWLVLFHADHDMVYKATLRWFANDTR
jgi:pimeloyl-ACP methyl ester carboxylesterase